jgi:hypothetical protein
MKWTLEQHYIRGSCIIYEYNSEGKGWELGVVLASLSSVGVEGAKISVRTTVTE